MRQAEGEKTNDIRPVFITYPTIYSLLMLNYLIEVKRMKFAGVILSTAHIKRMAISFSFLESSYILMKRSGFWYGLYLVFTIKSAYLLTTLWWLTGLLAGKRRLFKTFGQLFRENRIPFLKSKNINNQESVNFMHSVDANLIISSYNNQILKYSTCKKFEHGAVGIHNSYLPDFGGLDAAFETLYQGVKEAGVTVHLIDKGIDTGRIIYQEKIPIDYHDTVFTLNLRQWLRGAQLIPQTIDLFRKGSFEAKEQDRSSIKYPYESFPRREKVEALMNRGKSCISLKDIFVMNPYVFELFSDEKSG